MEKKTWNNCLEGIKKVRGSERGVAVNKQNSIFGKLSAEQPTALITSFRSGLLTNLRLLAKSRTEMQVRGPHLPKTKETLRFAFAERNYSVGRKNIGGRIENGGEDGLVGKKIKTEKPATTWKTLRNWTFPSVNHEGLPWPLEGQLSSLQ